MVACVINVNMSFLPASGYSFVVSVVFVDAILRLQESGIRRQAATQPTRRWDSQRTTKLATSTHGNCLIIPIAHKSTTLH